MKLSCPARQLARALDAVVHIIRNRPALPVLAHVLLEAADGRLALTTTDLEVGVRRSLPVELLAPGATAAPARLLADLAAALPDERLSLEVEGGTMRLGCGRFATTICTLDAKEFPPGPQAQEVDRLQLPSTALLKAIEQVRPAISTDTARPVLTGMLFRLEAGRLELVATDTHRLAVRRLAGVEGGLEAQLVVPASALGQLPRVFREESGSLEVLVSSLRNQVFFRSSDAEVASRLLEGQFPDHERLVPEQLSAVARLQREDLVRTVRAVALFAGDRGARPVRLRCGAGSMRVMAATEMVGDADAKLPAQLSGEEFQIAFNARYLLDALAALEGDEVELCSAGALAPGLLRDIESDECLHLIMPIRLAEPALGR
jgi:DNA polymerase III subunit beta